MYLGRIVEIGPVDEVFERCVHPYTKALLAAVPDVTPSSGKERPILGGDVPSPLNPPSGCAFHPRCPHAIDKCRAEMPLLTDVRPEHRAACHVFAEGKQA
jgi:oligopeptide/dipeptide ABC transporter ATP-binding protein